jgi:hypothetical protein
MSSPVCTACSADDIGGLCLLEVADGLVVPIEKMMGLAAGASEPALVRAWCSWMA